ncbi:MAG: efflux RND transporter periplasmic adaptor subunit [Omnitrophica WOR_2 bacterium]
MKRNMPAWLGVVLALIFAFQLSSCVSGGSAGPTPTPIPQIVNPEKIIFTVQRGSITSQRDYSGEIVPARQTELFFRANGYINRVTVKAGDSFKKGDVLAELQIDDLLNQLEQAKIDLQVAQDNSETEKLQHAYDLQKAESDVAVLQIQLDQSRKQGAQTEATIDEERLKTAQAWLALVKGKKETSLEQVVQRSQLAVDRLANMVADRQVLAPYDGVVLRSFSTPGMTANAFDPIFIIGDPKNLVLRVLYDYDLAHTLEPGITAYVSPTKSKEKQYPIQYIPDFLPVTSLQSGIETTNSGETKLNFFYFSLPKDFPLEQAPVGRALTVTVVLGKKDNALLLPPAAIRGNDAFQYVIVLEDDTHRRVEVLSVGLKSTKLWEVIANLKEGDRVLGP